MSQAQKSRLMRWSLGLVMSLTLVSIALLLVDPGKPVMAQAGGGDCVGGGGGGGAADCITVGGPCVVDADCDEGFVCDNGTCVPEDDCIPMLDASGDPIPGSCYDSDNWEDESPNQEVCLGAEGPPFGSSSAQTAPEMAAMASGHTYSIVTHTVQGTVTINSSTGQINAINVTGPGSVLVRVEDSEGLVGYYVVECKCCGFSGVDSIVVDETNDPGPVVHCLNELLTLRAVPDGECGFDPDNPPVWSYQSSPAGLPSPFSGVDINQNVVVRPTAAGAYLIIAGSMGYADAFLLNAFGLTKIIVKDSDPHDEGPVDDVLVGDTVALEGVSTDQGEHSWSWQVETRPPGSTISLTGQGKYFLVTPDAEGMYRIKARCSDGLSSSVGPFVINAIRIPSITSINAWDFTGGSQGQLYTDGIYIPAEQNLSLKLQAVGDATFPEQAVINWTATSGAGSFQNGVSTGETVYFDRTVDFVGAITFTATVANASDGTSQKTFVVNSYTSEMTVADNANPDVSATSGTTSATLNLFADGNGDAQIRISFDGNPSLPSGGMPWRVKQGTFIVAEDSFTEGNPDPVVNLNTPDDVTTFVVESGSGSPPAHTVHVNLLRLDEFTFSVADSDHPAQAVTLDGQTNNQGVLKLTVNAQHSYAIDMWITGPEPAVADSIYWRIDGNSANESNGGLGPSGSVHQVILTPAQTVWRFTAHAGYDLNDDDSLGAGEESHSVSVFIQRDFTLTVQDNASPSNKVEIPSYGNGNLAMDLSSCETSREIKLKIDGVGGGPEPVFWKVLGETAGPPSEDDFNAGTEVIIPLTPTASGSPPETNTTFTVLVGYELDGDQQWHTEGENSEVTHRATVTVTPQPYELTVRDHSSPENSKTRGAGHTGLTILDIVEDTSRKAQIDVLIGGRPDHVDPNIKVLYQVRSAVDANPIASGNFDGDCEKGPFTLEATTSPPNLVYYVEVGLDQGPDGSTPNDVLDPMEVTYTIFVRVIPGVYDVTPDFPSVIGKGQGKSFNFSATLSPSATADKIEWECNTAAGAIDNHGNGTATWDQNNVYVSGGMNDVYVRARYRDSHPGNMLEDIASPWVYSRTTIADIDLQIQGLSEQAEDQAPGAIVALNNDDDDNNGNDDSLATSGLTSGNDDDLVPLVITVTPSDLNVGTVNLTKSASPGSGVRIWTATNKATQAVQWDLATDPFTTPRTVHAEGVLRSGAAGDEPVSVDLTLAQETLVDDAAKMTIVEVTSVVWQTTNSPLEDIDSGKRIYPGKQNPTDTVNRKTVQIRAQIAPAVQGYAVHFKSFDVDDPSANSPPLDDETDANDNRGSPKAGTLSTTSGATDADGYANVTLTVTMHAGDNFRVVGHCLSDYGDNLKAKPDDSESRIIRNVGSQVVPDKYRTKRLTVWRRLWIEQDSMARPTLAEYRFTSNDPPASITPNSPVAGRTTIDLGVNLPDSFSDEDMYEEGKIVFLGCTAPQNAFTIFSNTSVTLPWEDDEIVIVGVPPACAYTSNFRLEDDDDATVLPHYPSAGTLGDTAFAKAYVTLVYVDSSYRDLVDFDLNLNIVEVISHSGFDNAQDLDSSREFWLHLVVGCFQGSQNADYDPDVWRNIPPLSPLAAEDPLYAYTTGTTFYGLNPVSAIYMETLRDDSATGSPGTTESHVVTHEIVHARGGNTVHEDGGLMSEGAPQYETGFTAKTLERIRSKDTW